MRGQHGDLVPRIYDTIADPGLWTDVLEQIASSVGAGGSLIFEMSEEGALTASHSSAFYRADALQEYLNHHAERELKEQKVFVAASLAHDGVDIIDDRVLYDDLAEFRTRPNINHVRSFGLLHRAGALLNKDNPETARFSVQFHEGRGGITDAERAHLNGLLPHVAKALDLGRAVRKVASAHAALLAAMDRLTVGLCLLDATGRMIAANEEFRRQEEALPAISFTADGRLTLATPEQNKRLSALMSHVAAHGQYGARPRKEAIPTGRDGFLCLEVAPLERAAELGANPLDGFLLFSTDTSQPIHCNTSSLASVYGLTPAETELTRAIADGLTNAAIAEIRDRSVATINAQVKSILSKTGCTSRTQFVRLMLCFGSPALRD